MVFVDLGVVSLSLYSGHQETPGFQGWQWQRGQRRRSLQGACRLLGQLGQGPRPGSCALPPPGSELRSLGPVLRVSKATLEDGDPVLHRVLQPEASPPGEGSWGSGSWAQCDTCPRKADVHLASWVMSDPTATFWFAGKPESSLFSSVCIYLLSAYLHNVA